MLCAVAAAAPGSALRPAPPSRALRTPPRSDLRCRRGLAPLRVRASVHEDEPPPRREGVGHYLARAAASLFAPADDHGVKFPLMPFEGKPLRAKDRARLARYEQVLRKARDALDAPPAEDAGAAHPHQHQDIGHWLAEAAATVFTKPDVADEKIFKGTLSGWSGEVVPPSQRKRLVGRLDALRSHVSELKEAAPERDDDNDAR